MKIDGCSALITGASAGIGRELARQLANRARTLILVARREERLNELRDELRNLNAQLNMHVRVVDLCRKSEINELIDWLPQMIARKRGAILNVSSSAGFLPIPGMSVYSASKAYVNSFSAALRAELRGTGVSVSGLCPGPVHTEFGDVAKRPGGEPERAPEFIYVSVEKTARDALAAVESDRPLVIPGLAMKLGMFLVRITPMSILRLAWRFGAERSNKSGGRDRPPL